VTNAAPREVYFQAQTLLKKANRLAFEFTASLVEQPKAAEVQEIKPAHVWRTLDEALKRVLVVRRLPRH
jgi:hypothetical protein